MWFASPQGHWGPCGAQCSVMLGMELGFPTVSLQVQWASVSSAGMNNCGVSEAVVAPRQSWTRDQRANDAPDRHGVVPSPFRYAWRAFLTLADINTDSVAKNDMNANRKADPQPVNPSTHAINPCRATTAAVGTTRPRHCCVQTSSARTLPQDVPGTIPFATPQHRLEGPALCMQTCQVVQSRWFLCLWDAIDKWHPRQHDRAGKVRVIYGRLTGNSSLAPHSCPVSRLFCWPTTANTCKG